MREGLPSLAEARAAFLDDVAIAWAPLTRTAYATRLRVLTDADWPLTPAICRRLIRQQLDTYARSTARNFCGVLSAFGKFCVEQGWLLENPIHGIPFPKATVKPHRWLTRNELERLWQAALGWDTAPPRRGPSGASYAVCVALLCLGLRVSEACSVNVEDIDGDLLLVKGKGSKYRYVPLPDIPLPQSGRLLPVQPRRVQHMLERLGRETGIPHLHPHLLRHSWASISLMDGAGVGEVQAVGGWATDRMVRHYAASVYQRAAARSMRRFRIV